MFLELDLEENKPQLVATIKSLAEHIGTLEQPSQHQQVFIKAREQYGDGDVGLLFIFFLNVLTPQPG